MTVERETKLVPPPEFELPDLRHVLGELRAAPADSQTLEAIHYDTPTLTLARAGITLRFRSGESHPGWTLKLPAETDGSTLSRHELTFPGDAGSVPDDAADLVAVHVRHQTLLPVATLRTERTKTVVNDAAGQPVVEVVDDLVKGLKDDRMALFREIEIELRRDDRTSTRVARDLVALLVEHGCSEVDPVPKAIRVLGEGATSPPDVVVPAISRHSDISALVGLVIAKSVLQLMRHDPGVRRGDDVEDVHRFRVATRRLRSDLRTFHDFLDSEWAREARDELKWLGGEVGHVRDADVLGGRLLAMSRSLPPTDRGDADHLLQQLSREREQHRVAALTALRSERYLALVDKLVEAAATPPVTSRKAARAAVRPVVRGQWRHLRNEVRALGADQPDDALHRVRIRAKRCRYAAEAAVPVLGGPAARFAKAIEGIQGILGDHHDAVVAESWLRAAARAYPNAALVAGELVVLEQQKRMHARESWRDVWRSADRKTLRRWLEQK